MSELARETGLEMTDASWKRIEEIFEEALDVETSQRAELVRDRARGDESVIREVLALLEADAEVGGSRESSGGWRVDSPGSLEPGSGLGTGSELGPYRLGDELGAGGMGRVFVAERDYGEFQKSFALKVIRSGYGGDTATARFLRERKTLARMQHPGIATLVDVGATAEGTPYLVMELVEGAPITEEADRRNLSLEERLRLFRRVLEAVAYAHRNLVVHRDLKPSNILVTSDGSPKLLDFGISKLLNDEEEEVTRPGSGPMTPHYASPEQAEGDLVTTATDVFSLGVLLHELLSGVEPRQFRKDLEAENRGALSESPSTSLRRLLGNETEEAMAVGKVRKAAPLRLVHDLRGDLDTIVMTAMHPDPDRRYSSVEDFSRDLERFLSQRPIHARPATWSYRTGLFVKRHRALLAGTLIATVAIAIGAVTVVQSLRKDRERLEDILRLADLKRYEDIVASMGGLHPVEPSKAEAMRTWLDDARDLVQRLPRHQESLARLTASDADDTETQWQREALEDLVTRLEALGADDPYGTTIRCVEARLSFAEEVRSVSIESEQERWEEAIIEIADSDRYSGLVLIQQLGLVPIGFDPDSELYEFWHVQSGEEPERDEDGRLWPEAEHGMVFVLIPGGSCVVGAQSDDPNADGFDEFAQPLERPLNTVSLDPFFLSKYEVTQAQWKRIQGVNPSGMAPFIGEDQAPTYPVEMVTWQEARAFARLMGLSLPTEAQWEWAARGGQEGRWPTGDSMEDLELYANLADVSTARAQMIAEWLCELTLDDGHAFQAPIDALEPNPFGLHHVLGNVQEWCADPLVNYGSAEARPGDGLRINPAIEPHAMRGGAWNTRPSLGRLTARFAGLPAYASNDVGLRPSRVLDRSPR